MFRRKEKPKIDTNNIKSNAIERWFARINFNTDFRVRLYKKLASGMENGIKDIDIIENLQKRYEKKNLKDPIAVALREINKQARSNGNMAMALKPWVTNEEMAIIESGYASGNVPDAMRLAVKIIVSSAYMKSTIKKALTYPALLLVATVGVVWFIGTNVVPSITESVGNMATWSAQAQSLFSLADFVQSNAFLYGIGSMFVLAILISKTLSSSWNSVGLAWLRRMLDKLPPWSIYKEVQGASFMISLSSMLASGITMHTALIRIANNSSDWTKHRITQIILAQNRGNSDIGDAMHNTGYNFPDYETIEDVRFYQNLDNLEKVLYDIGESNIDRTIDRIQKAAGLINFFALMTMISMVFWIVVGVLGVQGDISSSLGV